MALALERFLVPGIVTDEHAAYAEALCKVCTSLTKGWFRDFAVQSWPKVCWRLCIYTCGRMNSLTTLEHSRLLRHQVKNLDRDLLAIVREHAEPLRVICKQAHEAAEMERRKKAEQELAAALSAPDPGAPKGGVYLYCAVGIACGMLYYAL